MFEKEAEEYGNSFEWTNDDKVIDYSKQGFQKGAEFGYHEGFKDCEKSRLNVTTISDCPIKDDWHYVKDELPPEDVPLLCVRGGMIYVAWYWGDAYHNSKCCQVKKPYAWKEIVLPEIKESE